MIIVCPECSGPFQVRDGDIANLVQVECPSCTFRMILDFEAANDPQLVEAGTAMAAGYRSEAEFRRAAGGGGVLAPAPTPAPAPTLVPTPVTAAAPAAARPTQPVAEPALPVAAGQPSRPPAAGQPSRPPAAGQPSRPPAAAEASRPPVDTGGPDRAAPALVPDEPGTPLPMPADERAAIVDEPPVRAPPVRPRAPASDAPQRTATMVMERPVVPPPGPAPREAADERRPPHTPPAGAARSEPSGQMPLAALAPDLAGEGLDVDLDGDVADSGASQPVVMDLPPPAAAAASPTPGARATALAASPLAPSPDPVPERRSRVGLVLILGLLLIVGGLVGGAYVTNGDPNPIPFVEQLIEQYVRPLLGLASS